MYQLNETYIGELARKIELTLVPSKEKSAIKRESRKNWLRELHNLIYEVRYDKDKNKGLSTLKVALFVLSEHFSYKAENINNF